MAKKNFERSNLNIGGFNVPISTLLKKATGDKDYDETKNEASILVFKSNQLQKWFIYWIVNTGIDLLINGLFLSYILPFYSFLRLGLSIWLLMPFFKFTSIKGFNEFDDLNLFFQSGCGFVYSYTLDNFDLDSILQNSPIEKVYENITIILNMLINVIQNLPILIPFKNKDDTQTSMKSWASTFGYFKESEPKSTVEDEYDVIDSPSKTESTGIDSEKPMATKRGWIW